MSRVSVTLTDLGVGEQRVHPRRDHGSFTVGPGVMVDVDEAHFCWWDLDRLDEFIATLNRARDAFAVELANTPMDAEEVES